MNRTILPLSVVFFALAATTASLPAQDVTPLPQTRGNSRGESAESRSERFGPRNHPYYDPKFDLSDLPPYVPEQKVKGTIRVWGLNYLTDSHVAGYWDEGFAKFQPDAKVAYTTPTGLVAFPGLITGLADIGADRKLTFDECLTFNRVFACDPLEVIFASGSMNVSGWAPAIGIFVHKDNPLTKITLRQIDGVFGAERDGAYIGTTWHPEFARGPEQNIRTWGQLGLTGEWADKPIGIYGRALKLHQQIQIEAKAFQGGSKWNEKLHECYREMLEYLDKDRYGMAIGETSMMTPQVKILSLAGRDGGPYVDLTLENCQNRTYPLHAESYFYLYRKPGAPLDPKVREFLRFVLSREGQDAIQRDGKWLPLTGSVVREELRKLD
jgi:phosphate transport system substrate-binding protein